MNEIRSRIPENETAKEVTFDNPSFDPAPDDFVAITTHEDTLNGDASKVKASIENEGTEPPTNGSFDLMSFVHPEVFHYLKWCIYAWVFLLFHVYLGFGIHLSWEKCNNYCSGIRLFVIIIAFAYFIVLYPYLKRLLKRPFKSVYNRVTEVIGKRQLYWRIACWLVVWTALIVFVVVDSLKTNKYRLVSLGGMAALLILGFIFSKYKRQIAWSQVMWGIMLQYIMALIVLRWEFGKQVFNCLGNKTSDFLGFTNEGAQFVFGYLATGELQGVPKQATVFAFSVLPVVIYFSFFVSILYYYGIMQVVVIKVGWLLQVTIGTTACESMSAAGNIFLGQTEAPLIIRPYLSDMTKSELHSVMTGGFATIAGSVMAAFISLGVDASHLLTASVMSAPAALAFAKLLYPETGQSKTQIGDIKIEKGTENNVLEAAANGTSIAIKLVGNIVANLIAFVAFIHFMNSILNYLGRNVSWDELTFQYLLRKIFTPLAFLIGVEWKDCEKVGELIGLKTFLNEFIAYEQLAKIKDAELQPRSAILATYALCGFSNLSSIGIMLGGLGALAPSRRGDLADMAIRALCAGSAACFMTACVAGTLID